MGSDRISKRSARDGFRTAAGARFCEACDDGCRSVISGRGVAGGGVGASAPALPGVWGDAGMAHCGVNGEADIGRRHQVQPEPTAGLTLQSTPMYYAILVENAVSKPNHMEHTTPVDSLICKW
jgi:hypothetical protein